MKYFTAALALSFVCSLSQFVAAQTDASWLSFSPAGENFTVQMPQTPTNARHKSGYGDLEVEGRVYTAVDGRTTYEVWSLKNPKFTSVPKDYLDLCADLVWESLLRPVRDKLPKEAYVYAHMDYVGGLGGKGISGREYLLTLDKTTGVTNFYVDDERVYVLAILNARRDSPETERFLKSFSVKTSTPPATLVVPVLNPSAEASTGGGVGMGAGVGPATVPGQDNGVGVKPPPAIDENPNRIFSGRDVTERARILTKPNPQYTDSARKYRVQGSVTIRAVLSREGQVTNIRATNSLPHGLTEKAIEAARGIKFEPAVKDGRKVSQYILLEYHFNLY